MARGTLPTVYGIPGDRQVCGGLGPGSIWFRTIGRICGHIGRKGNGRPGVRTLWRGWRDLEIITRMYEAMSDPWPTHETLSFP